MKCWFITRVQCVQRMDGHKASNTHTGRANGSWRGCGNTFVHKYDGGEHLFHVNIYFPRRGLHVWTPKHHKNLQTWCGAAQQPGTGAGISRTRQYGSTSVLQRNYNPRIFTRLPTGSKSVKHNIIRCFEEAVFILSSKKKEKHTKIPKIFEKSDWQTCSVT